MAKTLLEVVKTTLNAMGSDPVKSIYLQAGGTEESEEIAVFARELFDFMATKHDWPYNKKLMQLEPLADSEKPNYLKLPDNCQDVEFIKYRESDVTWLTPESFLDIMNGRNTIIKDTNGIERNSYDDDVEEVLSMEGVTLYVRNSRNPQYYTSFDGVHLVFDSYDKTNEDTLQNVNSTALLTLKPELILSDDHIIDLPPHLLPLFQAELNREAILRIKQQDSAVDAKRAITGWALQRQKANRLNKRAKMNFGRK